MKTPKFWYSKNNLYSKLLIPLSFIWILGSFIKRKKAHKFSNIKIIKIGNVVVGGAGKTPTTIAIAKKLINSNYKVHIIAKGYKGSLKITTLVNSKIHSFKEVGDEALILSKIAPTWIGNNRIKSINEAIKNGAEVAILDDGIQDNSIHGNLNFLVFNGFQGIGNGRIIPAGPMRENLFNALKKSHIALIIEEDKYNLNKTISNHIPVINAKINVASQDINNFKNKNVVAFCGLGYPLKFFQTLEKIGCNILYSKIFPDHHKYTNKTIQNLLKKANSLNSLLITTEKDYIKISKQYKNKIFYFPIEINFLDTKILDNILSSLQIKK